MTRSLNTKRGRKTVKRAAPERGPQGQLVINLSVAANEFAAEFQAQHDLAFTVMESHPHGSDPWSAVIDGYDTNGNWYRQQVQFHPDGSPWTPVCDLQVLGNMTKLATDYEAAFNARQKNLGREDYDTTVMSGSVAEPHPEEEAEGDHQELDHRKDRRAAGDGNGQAEPRRELEAIARSPRSKRRLE